VAWKDKRLGKGKAQRNAQAVPGAELGPI
jgi:hypothetical protein